MCQLSQLTESKGNVRDSLYLSLVFSTPTPKYFSFMAEWKLELFYSLQCHLMVTYYEVRYS